MVALVCGHPGTRSLPVLAHLRGQDAGWLERAYGHEHVDQGVDPFVGG